MPVKPGYLGRTFQLDPCRNLLNLSRQKVGPHCEHLAADAGGESINLPCVLLDLPAVEQSLESARLLWQLEQPLPLILRKRCLFADNTLGILCLALLLPLRDLSLLSCKRSLVELVVVELGVVAFYAVQKKVAGLLEEGVDREIERFEVGGKRSRGE